MTSPASRLLRPRAARTGGLLLAIISLSVLPACELEGQGMGAGAEFDRHLGLALAIVNVLLVHGDHGSLGDGFSIHDEVVVAMC